MRRHSADTFADGLATRSAYEMTFGPAARAGGFVTVTDAEIAEAMRLLLRTTHNLAEGAGAAGLAGLMRLGDELAGKRVGIILSGGNIDRATLARVVNERDLTARQPRGARASSNTREGMDEPKNSRLSRARRRPGRGRAARRRFPGLRQDRAAAAAGARSGRRRRARATSGSADTTAGRRTRTSGSRARWALPPHPGAVWVAGHWKSTPHGWVWKNGHWH